MMNIYSFLVAAVLVLLILTYRINNIKIQILHYYDLGMLLFSGLFLLSVAVETDDRIRIACFLCFISLYLSYPLIYFTISKNNTAKGSILHYFLIFLTVFLAYFYHLDLRFFYFIVTVYFLLHAYLGWKEAVLSFQLTLIISFLGAMLILLLFNTVFMLLYWLILVFGLLALQAYLYHKPRRAIMSFLRARDLSYLSLFNQLFHNQSLGFIITDEKGYIYYTNRHFLKLTGYSKNEVIGKRTSMLQSGRTPQSTYHSMWKAISSGYNWTGVVENRRKDGSFYWEDMTIFPLKSHGEIVAYFSIKSDISYSINQHIQLEYEANYDEVTGLLRRNKFKEIVSQLLGKDENYFMLMVDVDDFKEINDTYGHVKGDLVLSRVSRSILRRFGKIGVISRYGGDEVLIFTKEINEDGLLKLIELLRQDLYSLSQDIGLSESPIRLSIGYARVEDDIESAIEHADHNMYLCKQETKRNRNY